MRAAPPASADAVSSEASRRIRIPFFQKAVLSVDGREEELFMVDLGHSGAFAEREEALPVGHRVALRFRLPGNSIPLSAGCRVAWWHPPAGRLVSKNLPAGLGLEFVELAEEDRGRLARFLADYLARGSRERRFHRLHPLDPLEEEPGEEEGVP